MLTKIRLAAAKTMNHGLPHVMIANIAQQAVAFLGIVVIARLLPSNEFALVRIAIAYAAVATIVGAGGLTAPILRYCADPHVDFGQRQRLLGVALRWLAVISSLTMAVCLSVILLWNRHTTERYVLMFYAFQIPALAGTSLLLVYVQAMRRFRLLAYSQMGIRTVSLLFTISACYAMGLIGFLFATLATSFIGFAVLYLLTKPVFERRQGDLPGDFLSLAGFALLGMVISTIGQYADLLILDIARADQSRVGAYSLATIFFFAASALAGAVQGVATPHFTGLIRDRVNFRASLLKWSLWLTLGGFVTAIGAVVVAWTLETFFLRQSYAGLSSMVALLMLRFWIWCIYAVGGAAMVGIGAIRQGTSIAFITTIFAIAASYPLVLRYGVWGAGIAQVLVSMLTAALVLRVVIREVSMLPLAGDERQ